MFCNICMKGKFQRNLDNQCVNENLKRKILDSKIYIYKNERIKECFGNVFPDEFDSL